ncbi:hypothetical protein ACXZ66_00885 [Corynebacterium sp. S7]
MNPSLVGTTLGAIEFLRALKSPAVLLGAVVVVGAIFRTIVAAQGWFYWDDLILQSKARAPLGELLLQTHDGHFMPAAWIIEWFLGNFAPLNWPVAVAVLTILQLWAVGSVAWANQVIAGKRALLPVLIYVVTPLTLPSTTWLAAAVNALPMHAAIAMMLSYAWRSRPAMAALWLVIGLLFNERTLFAVPLVVGMLLCFALASRRLPASLPGIGRLTVALAIPAVAWSALYFWVVERPAAGEPLSFWALARHTYLDALVPTAAGGPWHWERWQPSPPWAAPQWYAVVAGLVVIALVAWWSRRYLVAWLPALVYPLLPIVAIMVARSGSDTALEIVQSLRHFSELAVVVSLTFAYLSRHLQIPRIPVALFVASSLVSSVTYAQVWSEQPSRTYFHNLQADLEARSEPLLDQQVPLDVLLPVTYPHNLLSHQLPEAVASSTRAPTLVDDQGHIHDAVLFTQRSSSEETTCGTESFALDGPLFDVEWTVLLNYMAEADMTADVSLDGQQVRVPLQHGLNQVYVRVAGGGSTLHVVPVSGTESQLCLGASHVGVLGVG